MDVLDYRIVVSDQIICFNGIIIAYTTNVDEIFFINNSTWTNEKNFIGK